MKRFLALVVFATLAAPASARDISIDLTQCATTDCQKAFESMSTDAIALIDYKALGPAEATGISGIGIGAIASYLPVKSDSAWRTVANQNIRGIGMAGAQVTKGLPLDIDVGAFYTVVPDTSVKIYGGEFRYAILAGSTVSPALALRGSYSTMAGVKHFKVNAKSVDLSLSKGFAVFTPYVGVGYVWGDAKPDQQASGPPINLKENKTSDAKAYIGMRIRLGFFGLTPEVERIGDRNLYNLRAGFSF